MKFRYCDVLPISSYKEQIVNEVVENDVVVVVGETGSGKSTQIPKMILEALAKRDGSDPEFSNYKVVCTQPRRIAATSIANWIAEDTDVELGQEVGYKIRFDDETMKGTLITICTDGILLQEMKGDNLLSNYDAVLVDEAHERNLNIDFLLGLLKNIQYRRIQNGMNPLKILVTSATVDAQKFADFYYELNAGKNIPIINVSGRTYPVEVKYLEPEAADAFYKQIAELVKNIVAGESPGDILIFMPGEYEIFSTIRAIDFLRLRGVNCLPLYSRLTMDEQQQIFADHDGINVVVATNIAETSLTVPGVKYVIDSGLAKLKDFDFRTGIGSLDTRNISQASAIQRAGRAGRIEPGVCYRLYSEENFNERIKYTIPEIRRSDLASVVLHMILIGITDVYNFSFIDPPEKDAFRNAFKVLHELGALENNNSLTPLGVKMAHLPLEPRISAMLLAAEKYDCVRQVAVIASSLSVKDPFVRPNDEEEEADAAKQYFQKMSGHISKKYKIVKIRKGKRIIKKKVYSDENAKLNYVSDLVTLLHVWNKVRLIQQPEERELYCQSHYLNFVVLEEIEQIYYQLIDTLRTFAGKEFEKYLGVDEADLKMSIENNLEGILKSITAGLIQNVCEQIGDRGVYRSGKSDGIMIHPGSALFYVKPKWFVSSEIVDTSRLYARNNTVINPVWLEEVSPHLCQYKVSNVYFDNKKGEVVRDEEVNFKGHRILKRKCVSVGEKEFRMALDYFVREGMVKGRFKKSFDFLKHNSDVVYELKSLAAMTANEKYNLDSQRLFDWYFVRFSSLEMKVYSRETLNNYIKKYGDDKLRMEVEDFISNQEKKKIEKRFPNEVFLNGKKHRVRYYFSHYKYPDGPVIVLNFDELNDLNDKSLEKIVPENKKFNPYLLVSTDDDFEKPVAEGYSISEIKENYDRWYLKNSWKKLRREIEERGVKGYDILNYFSKILEKFEIGSSLFSSECIYAYTGIKSEGRKFMFTIFGSYDDAKKSSIQSLKNLLKNDLKYKIFYKESDLEKLNNKNDQDKLMQDLWNKFDFEGYFSDEKKLKDKFEINKFFDQIKKNLKNYQQEVLKKYD
ncbi:DUF3418 domain-containing protein [Candidatus Peregrinibacteria bacterium]|nr:DUF3418 domain-containing protein [Candidatus Peregrinibacteria bacterium]